ncbi:Ribosome biogenesis protein [Gurleya vavrai]
MERSLITTFKKEKKEKRMPHVIQRLAKKLHGHHAIMFNQKRRAEKIQLKKDKLQKVKGTDKTQTESKEALPTFLLDREDTARALSDKVKQQRQEKASKYSVPIAKVKGIPEIETFSVFKSGKRGAKQWKRVVTKPCFVGDNFTRKAPKFERFIRPMAMRFKKAHVTHPELKATFSLPILGVKQNPHSELNTGLGVLSKGTIIEINVSELGIVCGSKIVWGKYAQITNHPENDGCVNAILLV